MIRLEHGRYDLSDENLLKLIGSIQEEQEQSILKAKGEDRKVAINIKILSGELQRVLKPVGTFMDHGLFEYLLEHLPVKLEELSKEGYVEIYPEKSADFYYLLSDESPWYRLRKT